MSFWRTQPWTQLSFQAQINIMLCSHKTVVSQTFPQPILHNTSLLKVAPFKIRVFPGQVLEGKLFLLHSSSYWMEWRLSQKWTGIANLTGKTGIIGSSFTSPSQSFSQSFVSIISDIPTFMHQIRHVAHAIRAGPVLWRKQLSSPGMWSSNIFH